MNLNEFIHQFGTEKKCVSYFKNYREKNNVTCTKCGSLVANWRPKNAYWRCKCGRKISLKNGTVMESSKLKLSVWLKAIFLMTQTKKPYSICEMGRLLGIKRYRTVWYLTMKIRVAMGADLCMKNYDEYFFILSKTEKSSRKHTKLENFSLNAIKKTGEKYLDEINLIAPLKLLKDVEIDEVLFVKNGYRCKRVLFTHEMVEFKDAYYATKNSMVNWLGKIRLNSNRILNGVHHGVDSMHLQKYMFEFSFRYNNRFGDKFNCLLSKVIRVRFGNNATNQGLLP